MPNWCNNFLTITGEEVQLNKIKYLLEETKETNQGMFITLVGLPEGITPEQHEKDWWDIHISHWGCKWDVTYEDHSALYDKNSITMSIGTAWSPPISFCEKLAVMFDVEVQIFYAEPGVGFAGLCTCLPDGTSQDDELPYMEGIYKYDNSGFWDEVDSNIEYQLEEVDVDELPAEIAKLYQEIESGEPSGDSLLANILDEYNFVSPEDKKQIEELIKEKLQDYGEA